VGTALDEDEEDEVEKVRSSGEAPAVGQLYLLEASRRVEVVGRDEDAHRGRVRANGVAAAAAAR
jgi:hypothetical protein